MPNLPFRFVNEWSNREKGKEVQGKKIMTLLGFQVDEQIPEISKVEELEVSTVESILPDEAVTASNRLQEELSVTYSERDPLETVARETNTLYVWPVYTT